MARLQHLFLTAILFSITAVSAQIPGGFYKSEDQGTKNGTEASHIPEREISPLTSELNALSGRKGRSLFFAMSDEDNGEQRLYFLELDQNDERFLVRLLRYFELTEQLMIRKGDELPDLNRLFVRRS